MDRRGGLTGAAARWLRRWWRDRHGAVAITMALAFPAISLAIGLSLDGFRLGLSNHQLVTALDAAVLSGARNFDRAEAEVRGFLAQGLAQAMPEVELVAVQVTADAATGRVTAAAEITVPTTFMRVAGIETMTTSAVAVAARSTTAFELALVIDVTSSMEEEGRMEPLKEALHLLLDAVFNGRTVLDGSYVALVPFSARVNVGNTRTGWIATVPASWKGCVEPRGTAADITDATPSASPFAASETNATFKLSYCPPPVVPLTTNKSDLETAVDALTSQGTTRIDHGAEWGWHVLSENWAGLWGTPGLPLPNAHAGEKIVVIMTDGGMNPDPKFDAATKARAIEILHNACQSMKAEGYRIVTVSYETSSSAAATLATCASDSTMAFEAPDDDAFIETFKQIGKKLSSAVRLVK